MQIFHESHLQNSYLCAAAGKLDFTRQAKAKTICIPHRLFIDDFHGKWLIYICMAFRWTLQNCLGSRTERSHMYVYIYNMYIQIYYVYINWTRVACWTMTKQIRHFVSFCSVYGSVLLPKILIVWVHDTPAVQCHNIMWDIQTCNNANFNFPH